MEAPDGKFSVGGGGVHCLGCPSPLPQVCIPSGGIRGPPSRAIELGTQVDLRQSQIAHVDSRAAEEGNGQHPGLTKMDPTLLLP